MDGFGGRMIPVHPLMPELAVAEAMCRPNERGLVLVKRVRGR